MSQTSFPHGRLTGGIKGENRVRAFFCTFTSEAIGKGVNQVLNFCFDFVL